MTLKKTKSVVNVSSAANARNLKADKEIGSSALAYAEKSVTNTLDFFAKVKTEQSQAHHYSKFTVDLKKKFDEVENDYPMDGDYFKKITDKWIKSQLEGMPEFLQPAAMQEAATHQASYVSKIMNLKWVHDDQNTWNDSERAVEIKMNKLDMAINGITSNPMLENEDAAVTLTKVNSLIEQEIGLIIGPYEKTLLYMNKRGYNDFTQAHNDKRIRDILINIEKKRVAAIYQLMPDGEKGRYLNDYINYQNGYQNERLEKMFGVNGNQSMTLNIYELTKDKNLRTDIIEYAHTLNKKYIVNKNNELSYQAEENNKTLEKGAAWTSGEVTTLNNASTIYNGIENGLFDINSPTSMQKYFHNHKSTYGIQNSGTFKEFVNNSRLVEKYMIPILQDHGFILPKDESEKAFILKGLVDNLDIKNTDPSELAATLNDVKRQNSKWGKLLNYTAKFNVAPSQLSARFFDLKHISPKNPEGIDEVKLNMGIYNYIRDINPSFDFSQLDGHEFYEFAYAKGVNRAGSNNEIAIAIEKYYGKDGGLSYEKREALLDKELNEGPTIELEPLANNLRKDQAVIKKDGEHNMFDKVLYNKLNKYNVKRDWLSESYLQLADFGYTMIGKLSNKDHIQKYWADRVQTFEEAPDGIKAILENGMFGTELSWVPGANWIQGITGYKGQHYISDDKRQRVLKEWRHQYLMLNDGTISLNSKEGEKLADIAMDKAIAKFGNYEINDTTYDANKWIHADHLEVANELGELEYQNLELSKDSKEYKNNLAKIENLKNSSKNIEITSTTWSPDISKYFDVNSKTSKTIMAADAEKIITDLYNNNKEEYIQIFGDFEPKYIIRNRKFTDGIQVSINENMPGEDNLPAMKLLIRDVDGNMYDLNELAGASNYRLYTKDVKLDKGLPFTYENLKEHKAIEQAEALTNNIKEFVPMSDGVENFVYETFLKLDRFATTVGNWEATLPSISNLWTDDINHKTYHQFSFAKWKKKNMEAANNEDLKWWGMHLDDNDNLNINAINKALGWVLNATDLDGKVFEYEDEINKAVFEIATKQKKYDAIEKKGWSSKSALTTPPDVPNTMYKENLSFLDWTLNNYNKKDLPFPFRTNNWLALWKTNNKWNGKINTAEPSKLEVFENPSWGIRAALINIANKSILVRNTKPGQAEAALGSEPTLKEFITKGHMPKEWKSYLAHFKKELGWEEDHIINLKDAQQMATIVMTMAYHENGKDANGNYLLDKMMPNKQLMSLIIQEGVNLYLQDTKWLDK